MRLARIVGTSVVVMSTAHALAVSQLPAPGWTIEETMRIRHVDEVRISPDQRRVLYTVRTAHLEGDTGGYRWQVLFGSIDGSDHRPLASSRASTWGAEWSPDGRWIAYLSGAPEGAGGASIAMVASTGGRSRPLVVEAAGAANLAWAPDGRSVAFTMPQAPSAEQAEAARHPNRPRVVDAGQRLTRVWVVAVAADGRPVGPPRAVTPGGMDVAASRDFGAPLDWSPDGRAIVFARPGTGGLAAVDVATGRATSLVGSPALSPKYSPDGRQVAFVGGSTAFTLHDRDVFVVPAAGGERRRLATTFDRFPTLVGWSVDGTDVYITEWRRTVSRLTALPVSGAPARDIDTGDAVIGSAALDRSRAMVAFTRQTLATPLEAHVATLADFRPRVVSRANADLPHHPLPRTEIIRWTSTDGADIEGLLTYPTGHVTGRPAPTVVIVRSGGVSFPQSFVANPFQSDWIDYYPVTTLAAEGYLVLQANSRGGNLPGYGAAHSLPAWAVSDKATHDIVAGVDHVVGAGLADRSRIGLMGFSNGGLVTAWLAAATPRFKAAVVYAGITDLVAQAAVNGLVAHDLGAEPWDDLRRYQRSSPILRRNPAATPTLILHGEADPAVLVTQGIQYYRALGRRGVPAEMVIYPGQGHGVTAPRHIVDVGRRQVQWMNRYVRGSGASPAGAPEPHERPR